MVKQLHLLIAEVGLFIAGVVIPFSVFSNPILNNVSSGNVTIQQTPNTTVVNQSSQNAIINWQSFNIGAQQATHFQQPAGGVALNRISGAAGASQIYGTLTATGAIILVNPAGIYFGPTAYVNVGAMIATTAKITDNDFLNGNYHFVQLPGYNGSIINAGTIIAAQHGLIALLGDNVSNAGLIQANLGYVLLGSGGAFTLSFAGNDLINFSVDAKALSAGSVTNIGTLIANGGTIEVSASAAQGVLDNIINMAGVAEARSLSSQNGEIILSGDPTTGAVDVTGTLDASGKAPGQQGGNVDITGYNILLGSTAKIDVSGDAGGGNIFVGGNEHGAGPLADANATVMAPGATLLANAITSGDGGDIVLWSNNVTKAYGGISAEGGANGGNGGFVETSGLNYLDVNGITVNLTAAKGNTGNWLLDPVADLTICSTCSTTATLSSNTYSPNATDSFLLNTDLETELGLANITVETSGAISGSGTGSINVDAPIAWGGTETLTLSAFHSININAPITATGATTLILTTNNNIGGSSSGGTLNFTPGNNIQLTNAGAALKINGSSYTLIQTQNELQNVNGSGNYALAENLNASSWIGFAPIAIFSGTFNGLGNTISNLTINKPSSANVGLFSEIDGSASLQNINLTNLAVTGSNVVGGLVGFANSTSVSAILNDSVSGTITSSGSNTGGIAGGFADGQIIDSYSSGSVISTGATAVGGLVGNDTGGTITSSYSSANVSDTATNARGIGGLAGVADTGAIIANSYAIGSVTAAGSSLGTGGLVGNFHVGTLTITDSYASGTVSGGSAGGLVGSGIAANLTVNNSFWDSITTGQSVSDGSTGSAGYLAMTTSQMMTLANFTNTGNGFVTGAGWNITSTISNSATPPSDTWFLFGSETRPILLSEYTTTITNAHQLQLAATTLGANFTLANNINASDTANASDIWGGNGFVPIGQNNEYSGIFNGNNNIISNLYINQPNTTFVGLFGMASGTVENLGLTNVNIQATGAFLVGALVSDEQSGGIINDTFTTGSINGGDLQIGGLVGVQSNSITNSFSSVNISTTEVGGEIGGLVGDMSNGSISNSYATGNVNAPNASVVGGLVGLIGGSVSDSYSTGQVVGASEVGGFAGRNLGSISQSFWDVNTSGNSSAVGMGPATGTTAGCFGGGACGVDLAAASTFNTIWDFTSTWAILSNDQSYPYLQWEFPTTPQAISGFITPNPSALPIATTVTLADNGNVVQSPVTSGVGINGFYFTLSPNGTFASGNDIIVMLSNGTSGNSVILGPSANGSISGAAAGSGLDITQNTLTLNLTNGSISPTALVTANANNTFANALYSVSGENITLNNDTAFTLATNSGTPTFTLFGNITTSGSGSITFPNTVAVSLGGSSLLSTGIGGSGTITLDSAITDSAAGSHALTLTSDNGVTIDNTIGGNSLPLLSLISEGASSVTTGNTAIDTTAITTTGTQTYSNAVTLGANVAITTTNNDVTFGSTVEGADSLSIAAGTGTVDFENVVGTVTPLTSLNSNGSGTVIFANAVGASTQRLGSVDITGNTDINGGSVYTTGSQTYTGAVLLGADTTLDSSAGGNIIFSNTLNGGFTLNTNTASGGAVEFDNIVGGATPLTSVIINNGVATSGAQTEIANNITTTGDQQYGEGFLLTANSILSGDNIVVNTSFNGAFNLTVDPNNAAGTFVMNGAGDSAATLTVGSNGYTYFKNGGGVFTTGNQIYNNTVTTNNVPFAATPTLQSTGGSITFNGPIEGYNTGGGSFGLTIDANTGVIINSTVGASLPLVSLTIGGTGTTQIASSITVSGGGNIDITTPITLIGTGAKTFAANTGAISLSSVNGAFDLILAASGTTTISGAVGTSTALTSLSSTGTGTVIFAGAVGSATERLGSVAITGTTDIDGGSVFTSGDQNYAAISLGAITTLDASTANIVTAGTVTNNGFGLTVNNGGAAGSFNLFTGTGSLTVAGSGKFALNGNNTGFKGNTIVSSGTLSIGNVNALGDTGTGTITVNGGTLSLDLGNNSLGNTNAITLNGSGVGGEGALFEAGTSGLGDTVTNAITLGSDTTIGVNTGGTLTLSGTINGAANLTVAGNGKLVFTDNVGTSVALTSLTVNSGSFVTGASTTTLDTVDGVTFNSAVTLGNNLVVDASGTGANNIIFADGISGNKNLTLMSAGNGTTYTISGPLAVNNISIQGGATTNNILSVGAIGGTQIWNINGNDTGSVNGISGVAGTFGYADIQNLNGGNAQNTFMLNGGSVSGSINGGTSGVNTIVGGSGTNTWTVNGANTGTVTGVTGFSNVQNLVGGASNNQFIMNGGSLSGSITGGSGTNTLQANNSIFNNWVLSGTNGGALTNLGAGFSNIQNLVGGNVGNTYVFNNGAVLTGSINGGSLSAINTLDFTAYSSAVTATLNPNIFSGSVSNGGPSVLSSYANINNIVGTVVNANSIQLPNKLNTVTINAAGFGSINDPVTFSGFTIFTAAPGSNNIVTFNTPVTFIPGTSNVSVNGTQMTFNNFSEFNTNTNTNTNTSSSSASVYDTNVSAIIQQPQINNGTNDYLTSYVSLIDVAVDDNINQVINTTNTMIAHNYALVPCD